MATAVASNAAYPSLQSVMDLFRSLVNTSQSGTSANTASFVLPFLNSAIQDTYADLRVIGAPRLLRDNVILSNLPLLTPVGSSQAQQYISFTGFFDGVEMHPYPFLPADLISPEAVWQRQAGTQYEFVPLKERSILTTTHQSYGLGGWKWEDDKIWLTGSTTAQCDIRLRYQATYPDFAGTTLDFTQTFVPIRTSLNAIAYKMAARYAFRLSPEQFPLAKQEAEEYTVKLQQEIVLQSQGKHQRR